MALQMLFPFVQLEFTHGIGPSPGRYVVGPLGAAPVSSLDSPDAITGVSMPRAGADVLVIGVVGTAASQPGRLRLRRGARDVVPEEPPREVQNTAITPSPAGKVQSRRRR